MDVAQQVVNEAHDEAKAAWEGWRTAMAFLNARGHVKPTYFPVLNALGNKIQTEYNVLRDEVK